MKKAVYIFGAALALAACTPKGADNTQQTETPAQEARAAASQYAPMADDGKVMVLEDSNIYAPGVKVPQLTVLDFNAVWCGPCRQLAPVLDELAIKYEGRVTFVSVDVDKFGGLFDAYRMGDAIPAVLFLFPDGSQKRYIGTGDLLPGNKFEALIDAALAK